LLLNQAPATGAAVGKPGLTFYTAGYADRKGLRPNLFFSPVPVGRKKQPIEKAQILPTDDAFILLPEQTKTKGSAKTINLII
jgi:hypothetical protein